MRRARPTLAALLLLLALAPAASAHDESDPNHRDTPADLAAADIDHTLALAHLSRTVAPDLPQYLPTTWCGAANRDTDDTAHAAFPASVRQIKVVYAHAHDQPDDFDRWKDALQTNVSRIEQFLALQTGGRRALRFDMGTVCGPQYVDIQDVHLPSNRVAYVSGTRRPELLRRGRRRRRRRRHDRARRVHPRRRPDRRRSRSRPRRRRQRRLGHRRGLARRHGRQRQLRQRGRPDGDDADPALDHAGLVGLAADGHAARDHAQPGRRAAVGRALDALRALLGRQRRHVLLRRQQRVPAVHERRVPHHRRRDPADLRLRPRRLLQPRSGAWHLPRHPLERLHQRLHGVVRPARHGLRRRDRALAAGQHLAARGRRTGEARLRGDRHGGHVAQQPDQLPHPVAALRRQRLGDHPGRGRARLPRHRRRRRRRPARGRHRDQRRRLGGRGLRADGAGRLDHAAGSRSNP